MAAICRDRLLTLGIGGLGLGESLIFLLRLALGGSRLGSLRSKRKPPALETEDPGA